MKARELSNQLAALLRNERNAMAEFLLALANFDQARAWRELGHNSLFSYLRRELGLSAGAAQYRKTAAELIQKFPDVAAALRDGRLCLSTVIEVAKVLTPENHENLLPRFFGLSRREAEEVAVSIKPTDVIPLRDVVTQVRPRVAAVLVPPAVPEDASAGALEDRQVGAVLFRPAEVTITASDSEPTAAATGAAPAPRPAPPPRDTVEPLDAKLSRIHVTVSKRFLAKLAAARDALSHSHPGASEEEILEAGLDLILAAQRKRNGLVERPLKNPRPSKPGHIPSHVRRAVWARDEGRCQFRLESGEICGSTYLVQIDHVHPEALGGEATVDNCRLACFGHNQLAARRIFGDEHMDRFARKRPAPDGVREREAVYCEARANTPRINRVALPAIATEMEESLAPRRWLL